MSESLLTRTVIVTATPTGTPAASDFALGTEEARPLSPGEVRINVETLSLDPYLRSLLGPGHLDDPAVKPGDVMAGRSIGRIIESADESRAVGTRVLAETGWREQAVLPASATTPVADEAGIPASAALGVLGMPGLTAYAAITRHITPQAGQTIVVSSATGGVGALAGQLARLAGARTVAIVGSEDKATLATETLGYDVAVIRGAEGWAEALRAACPEKIHGYLHMGDQATLDVVVEHLAVGAHVSLIGLMDQTNGAAPTRIRAGGLMAARATTYGMVVYDHYDLAGEHVATVSELLRSGSVVAPEERFLGLERAGEAFAALMAGRNRGKVVVDVSTEEPS